MVPGCRFQVLITYMILYMFFLKKKTIARYRLYLRVGHRSVAPQDRLVEAQAVLAFNLNPKDSA